MSKSWLELETNHKGKFVQIPDKQIEMFDYLYSFLL